MLAPGVALRPCHVGQKAQQCRRSCSDAPSLTEFGEAVENQLATKISLKAKVITNLAKKPLTLSASYADADGVMLFGVERSEETYSICASYPLWRGITASIGHRTTDSTIDFFDVSTPTFGIQFSSDVIWILPLTAVQWRAVMRSNASENRLNNT